MTIEGQHLDLIDLTVSVSRTLIERALFSLVPGQVAPGERRLTVARIILEDRRRRLEFFPDVRFGEPSWDMMLDIYIADHDGRQVAVSDLCVAANAPTTTALRHIGALVRAGYITRQQDPQDGRRTLLSPSRKLRASVEAWLDYHVDALAHLREAAAKQM